MRCPTCFIGRTQHEKVAFLPYHPINLLIWTIRKCLVPDIVVLPLNVLPDGEHTYGRALRPQTPVDVVMANAFGEAAAGDL